jgi:hypothetical protein
MSVSKANEKARTRRRIQESAHFQRIEDLEQLVAEAFVQHRVRLVDHDVLDVGIEYGALADISTLQSNGRDRAQRHRAKSRTALLVLRQSTGRRDQNID